VKISLFDKVVVCGGMLLVGLIAYRIATAPSLASVAAQQSSPQPTSQCLGTNDAALVMAEDFVKDRLKAPATARFPGWTEDQPVVTGYGNCKYEVNGWVDSQNGFGALLRSNWRVQLKPALEDGKEMWYLTSINID
jgi:hypothetical protein